MTENTLESIAENGMFAKDRSRDALWAVLLMSPAILVAVDFMPVLAFGFYAAIGALALLVMPRLAYTLFILAISVYAAVPAGPFAVMPVDMAFLICLLGTILDFLLRGETRIRWTHFDLPFGAILLFTYISLIDATDLRMSITPAFRILTIYFAFRMSLRLGPRIGVERVLALIVAMTTALAAVNSVEFLLAGGGKRVFGIAWLTFETLAMISLPVAAAWIIWPRLRWHRWVAVASCFVIGVGILATQSRAPLVAVAIAVPVLVFTALRKATKDGNPKIATSLWKIVIPISSVGVLLSVFSESFFSGTLGRVQELINSIANPEGTVYLRVVLWSAAIEAFLTDPLTGIGIGNFRVVTKVLPDLRMEPVWYYIRGMSTHNVVLQYLAETGIFGCLSILWLGWRGVKSTFRTFWSASSRDETRISGALFIALFVFGLTILYMRAWTWGQDSYIMAVLFGLAAAWQSRSALRTPSTKS